MLSGVTARCVDGEHGVLDLSQLEDKIRPNNEHLVRTRVVCLENTHNRGGGRIFPLEKVKTISVWARKHGLAMHLDGARLWNAVVATGVPLAEWGKHFDTVSVCFSKGLGAPVGSALVGPRDLLAKARRFRKLLGGGMRQAGVLAAAAHYALDNHIDRLADDHRNARVIAEAIADTPGLRSTHRMYHESDLVLCRSGAGHGEGRDGGAAPARRAGTRRGAAEGSHVHAPGRIGSAGRARRRDHSQDAAQGRPRSVRLLATD